MWRLTETTCWMKKSNKASIIISWTLLRFVTISNIYCILNYLHLMKAKADNWNTLEENIIMTHVIKIAWKSTIKSRLISPIIVRSIAIKSSNLAIFADFFADFGQKSRFIAMLSIKNNFRLHHSCNTKLIFPLSCFHNQVAPIPSDQRSTKYIQAEPIGHIKSD
jgi:hypothetical protein